jgi:hypothetical protein
VRVSAITPTIVVGVLRAREAELLADGRRRRRGGGGRTLVDDATGGASPVSDGRNSRPSTSRMPITAK